MMVGAGRLATGGVVGVRVGAVWGVGVTFGSGVGVGGWGVGLEGAGVWVGGSGIGVGGGDVAVAGNVGVGGARAIGTISA